MWDMLVEVVEAQQEEATAAALQEHAVAQRITAAALQEDAEAQ